MPVLNDLGPEAYARVVAQLDAFAARLGIQKEIIRQYWNDTGHLPQTLGELQAWGAKPDREYGQIRRDPTTGAWTPLATGPTPGKTPEERGGFPHFITNQVGEAQRFQQVDPNGNIFGGSWDPAYNAAHPELANQSTAALGQGPTTRTFASNPNNPYAGTPYEGAWDQANPSPGATPAPTPTAAGGVSSSAAIPPGADAGAAARMGLVDANAYGNTEQLQAQIDKAMRDYMLAQTAEAR